MGTFGWTLRFLPCTSRFICGIELLLVFFLKSSDALIADCPIRSVLDFPESLSPDEEAGNTACMFATTLLFVASTSLVGLLLEQRTWSPPPLELFRFLTIPIITLLGIILLGTGVEGEGYNFTHYVYMQHLVFEDVVINLFT